MMKFWLIVFLVNPNLPSSENYAGKFEVQYPSKTACEQARRDKLYMHEFVINGVLLVEDPSYKPICVSHDHRINGKPDANVPLD